MRALAVKRVTENIQVKKYEVTFRSLFQTGDGTGRDVNLVLVRSTGGGDSTENHGPVEVMDVVKTTGYQVRGVVVPEMNPFIYLGLLGVLAMLLALPTGLRRLARGH